MPPLKSNLVYFTDDFKTCLKTLTTLLWSFSRKDTDIKDSHEKVRDDSNIISFPFFGFCGCPVQSIQDVLPKRRE